MSWPLVLYSAFDANPPGHSQNCTKRQRPHHHNFLACAHLPRSWIQMGYSAEGRRCDACAQEIRHAQIVCSEQICKMHCSLKTCFPAENYLCQGDIVIALEYAKRYGDQNIVSISCNPGNLDSDLFRHMGSVQHKLVVSASYFSPIIEP